MNYRVLGRTGLQVSSVGFGCWAIGGDGYGPVKDEESLEALEVAWKHGVNFFDTADTYGSGHSEEILAKFLKGKPREKIVIATKVGHDFYHGAIKKDYSEEYIRFACNESLKRLNADYFDVYQLHNPSLKVIQDGTAIETLERLKQEGKTRFIGASVRTEQEAFACIQDGRLDVLQIVFNLIDQRMGKHVFAAAGNNQIGLIIREPLARGMLTEKYAAAHEFSKKDHRHGWSDEKKSLDWKKIDMIRTILATRRFSLGRASIEYILEFDQVGTVIPGAKTKEHVLENLKAIEEPELRSQETFLLRELHQREELFKKFV